MLLEVAPKIIAPLAVERGALGGSVNGIVMDALLRHRHDLYLIENGLVRGIVSPITSAVDELRKALSGIGGPYLSDLSLMPTGALRSLEREIDAIMASVEMSVTSKMRSALSDVARVELAAQDAIMQGAVPRAVGWQPWEATSADIAGILETPYHGSLWHQRLGRGAAETEMGLRQAARAAKANGRSGEALRKRFGTVVEGSYQGRVVATLRTETGRVANDALLTSYRRNAQTVESVTIVETLDDLTCILCASRDGMVVTPDVAGIEFPPYHANCRGFAAPVLKSWEEMGLRDEDLRPQERDALDGRVPGTVDYSTWFARQSKGFQRDWLGPSRFALYDKGGLEIKDMVKNYRVLRLDELPAGARR